MRPPFPPFAGLGIAVCLLGRAAGAAAAPTPSVAPASQVECFQMQFLLRLPNLESGQFVQDVAALQKDMDDGVPPTPLKISQLRQEADAVRRREEHAESRLETLLAEMGAPSTLKARIKAQQTLLSQPVSMSPDERQLAKSDPDTATILATLDECDGMKDAEDDAVPTIGAWLHVSYGAAGLWAADVGELTASLQVSVAAGQPPRLASSLPRRLAATAPAGTPPAALAALQSLVMPSGNLSGLAAASSSIPLDTAAAAAQSLRAVFGSNSLADLTPPEPTTTPTPVAPG